MLIKAVLVLSAIISSDCTLFADKLETDTTRNFSLFDGIETEIRKIFNHTATISVFLNTSQNSEHVVKRLSGIFQNDSKAFVVNNLLGEGMKKLNKSVEASDEDDLEFIEYYGFVFFNAFDTLKANMLLYTNPIGTFLFIVEGVLIDFDPEELSRALYEVWKQKSALKVFVLVNGNIYHFKPFEIDEIKNIRGKINILANDQKAEDFKNLNGYMLNIEMFYSVYTINHETTGSRIRFYGPDADVANFIQDKMNFTSNYTSRIFEKIFQFFFQCRKGNQKRWQEFRVQASKRLI